MYAYSYLRKRIYISMFVLYLVTCVLVCKIYVSLYKCIMFTYANQIDHVCEP